ncbi:TetR family transcriptional regulator [Catellatospora methionotrophica]|uniref:TetR family transcriptional regulator n=1 Tax=Catellatospora methionotrophica TaxID=121620 RepID=A0A8J3PI26_9ACTN|nr:TetR/AcrR family transcriptional regulator [Catellatospora methionotrophica]GIG17299.1 TetR family transcriptional regulator [Catellatospora methionotrophica]
MTLYGGQGDPARTMALLWRAHSPAATQATRPRSAPGPKQGLTVDAIIEAAIAVADADGMDRLSMRAVGERLGTSAMALYTYVPSKRELVDLMYDHAHAGWPQAPETGDRRAAVLAWADHLWDRYLRHPWLLQVSYARPVLGPNEQAVLESLLAILDGTSPQHLRAAVSALFHLVRGAAQTATEGRAAAGATGTSDEQWWTERSALLADLAPDFAQRFPHSTGLAGAPSGTGGYDPVSQARHALDGGLRLLLDGLLDG